MRYLQDVAEVVVLALGSAVVTIIIHELGHLLAVLSLGWKVSGVGFVSWKSLGVAMEPMGEARRSLWCFGEGLRFTALCGPVANIIGAVVFAGLAYVFRQGAFHHGLTPAIVLLAVAIVQVGGALQLIPSKDKAGNALGNDGNVVFRVHKNQVLLEELLSDDKSRS